MLDKVDVAQSYLSNEDEKLRSDGAGIMVLSSLLEPLHMNGRVGVLLSDLAPASSGTTKSMSQTDALPPTLVELAGKILSVLRHREETADKRQCEICYLADNSVKQVLIRGIGLLGEDGIEDARIVFVLTNANGYHATADSNSSEMT